MAGPPMIGKRGAGAARIRLNEGEALLGQLTRKPVVSDGTFPPVRKQWIQVAETGPIVFAECSVGLVRVRFPPRPVRWSWNHAGLEVDIVYVAPVESSEGMSAVTLEALVQSLHRDGPTWLIILQDAPLSAELRSSVERWQAPWAGLVAVDTSRGEAPHSKGCPPALLGLVKERVLHEDRASASSGIPTRSEAERTAAFLGSVRASSKDASIWSEAVPWVLESGEARVMARLPERGRFGLHGRGLRVAGVVEGHRPVGADVVEEIFSCFSEENGPVEGLILALPGLTEGGRVVLQSRPPFRCRFAFVDGRTGQITPALFGRRVRWMSQALATFMRWERSEPRAIDPPMGEGPPPSETLETLLGLDGEERFDLLRLNALDPRELTAQILRHPDQDPAVLRTVGEVLERVRQEVREPEVMREALRRRLAESQRTKAGPEGGGEGAGSRWDGLFADTYIPTGPRRPRLEERLVRIREVARPDRGLFRLGGSLGGKRKAQPLAPPSMANRVCQALLDDLSREDRLREESPLKVVSSLAEEVGRIEVNRALSALFPVAANGLFELPSPDASGSAPRVRVAPPAPSGKRNDYRLVVSSRPGGPGHGAPTGRDAGDTGDLWAEDRGSWLSALQRLRDHNQTLNPPNLREARHVEAYNALRREILARPEARRLFLEVAWKGRPYGMLHLARLLQEGVWEPGHPTDTEYLEAELKALLGAEASRDPQENPGVWDLGAACRVERRVIEGGRLRFTRSAPRGEQRSEGGPIPGVAPLNPAQV